jgi:predicted transcriptional regulator
MEVHLTPDLQAKLADSAARQGRNPDELVQDVLTRYFVEEASFVEAVQRGEAALQRGEVLTHEQSASVSSGLGRLWKPLSEYARAARARQPQWRSYGASVRAAASRCSIANDRSGGLRHSY